MENETESIKSKKAEIKNLLEQARSGADASTVKAAGQELLKSVSPADLALIEQELIQEGMNRQEMRRLCDSHLEIMRENLKNGKPNLEPGHPIHTLMEEHKIILGFIEKLKTTAEALKQKKGFANAVREIEVIRHIARHLVEADKHHQREEKALFPALEKHGVIEPPEIMKEEHVELMEKKNELHKIAELARQNAENKAPKNPEKLDYREFVQKANALAEHIGSELPNHIYKEDHILYPLALQVIPKGEWADIKKQCDQIGYCCFTPAVGDAKTNGKES